MSNKPAKGTRPVCGNCALREPMEGELWCTFWKSFRDTTECCKRHKKEKHDKETIPGNSNRDSREINV